MGTVKINNPHIEKMPEDHLYHVGLNTNQNLEELFGDTKFILMGGTPGRMHKFALYVAEQIGHNIPFAYELHDISKDAKRYSMFKVGPVVTVNHGMGIPSIGILLQELIKLMWHAKAKDPVFIRIGTCGGLGVEGGTVVISNGAVDGMLNDYYELPVLGQITKRPTVLDPQLAKDLKRIADRDKEYPTVIGKTMCTLDFYEGQARLDGAVCSFEEKDKMAFLQKCKDAGCINIEMESVPFAALTHQCNIRAACVCVALLNRLNGDQVNTAPDTMHEWEDRPMKLVAKYIVETLNGGPSRGCGCKSSKV